MAVRMISREVVFRRPFVLKGFDKVEPAGAYTVETEEESIDDVSLVVWKRLGTVIHITHGGETEYVRVDPEDLLKALARDSSSAEDAVAAAEARLAAARRPRGGARRATRRRF